MFILRSLRFMTVQSPKMACFCKNGPKRAKNIQKSGFSEFGGSGGKFRLFSLSWAYALGIGGMGEAFNVFPGPCSFYLRYVSLPKLIIKPLA